MRQILISLVALLVAFPGAAATTTPTDGDWSSQLVTLRNTSEAEVTIRVGDIDNLGFGFPEHFNPFCERATDVHGWPFQPDKNDVNGTDRIMVPTSFGDPKAKGGCGSDGYSGSASPETKPRAIVIPLAALKGVEVHDAVLQMFVDDFQSPVFCSKFRMWLSGRRFAEGELILNSLNQTGPIGKVVSFVLPNDMLDLLKGHELTILIDDPTTGAGDGFAIDFAKLMVNHKAWPCTGTAQGVVRDRSSGNPIAGASVEFRGYGEAKTTKDGRFSFANLPPGLQPVAVYAPGYNGGFGVADVWKGGAEDVVIDLDKATRSATFGGKKLREGESIEIRNIQFKQGKADLSVAAKAELDKIYDFLTKNPGAQIELSGHTSSEGGASANKLLSLRRVDSCKTYLVSKGIDAGRILTVGYGSERPIASNDTEAGRAKNRRVEMRILKLQ